MTQNMVQVSKDQFFAVIADVPPMDSGAEMHRYPEKLLRWNFKQWRRATMEERIGSWELVAYADMLLVKPYPYPTYYYVLRDLIDRRIIF